MTGALSPSGKMPYTLPYKYEDTPAARYGEFQAVNCKYNEDIFVGYRGFERDNIKPMFPFGHGLSYSEFTYSDLEIQTTKEGASVSFKVKNVGDVKAMETALYCGCRILATVHGSSREDLLAKPLFRSMMEDRVFERLVILKAGGPPGVVERILDGKGRVLC